MNEASQPDAQAVTLTANLGGSAPPARLTPMNLENGLRIGRYIILSKLGEGGMGVVYSAYDPVLDRKVALKFLLQGGANDSPLSSEARARFAREAQALARLNHPHIVAIHDVGQHQKAVWLAMEHLEGELLSAWLERRHPWPEVLDVMLPVAEALSAAHEAGLVHRDVKPDNIMLCGDGRVRVMDLGLARSLDDAVEHRPLEVVPARGSANIVPSQVTHCGETLGTPAYMSPEQHQGLAVDARVDVFSFCVTLWEALMGERPFAGKTSAAIRENVLSGAIRAVPLDRLARAVPTWLRQICLQGLAVDPDVRPSSMRALIREIARGQERVRLRKWSLVTVLVLVLGASATLYQRFDSAGRVLACEEAGDQILDTWTAEARDDLRRGLLATNLSYAPAIVDRVESLLDDQAESWREHRTQVCLDAEVEESLTQERLERALWCLEERREEFAALLTELSHADNQAVQSAVTAASSLSLVPTCTNRQSLAQLPSPPPEDVRARTEAVRATLSLARGRLLAGNYPASLELTRAALAEAEHLGQPTLAKAQALEGALLARLGAYEEAEAASTAAYIGASKAQAWDLAGRAASNLVTIVGSNQERHADGKLWAKLADVALELSHDPFGLGQADRLDNLANTHYRAGDYSAAKRLGSRALALREAALGPEHPSIAISLNSLANTEFAEGSFAAAKELYQQAVVHTEEALGPEHPNLAVYLGNLGTVSSSMGLQAEARALHTRELAIVEEALGPEHPQAVRSMGNLARTYMAEGSYQAAKELHERQLAIRTKTLGLEHPATAISLNNLANVYRAMGMYPEAKELYERALAIRERTLSHEHPHLAYGLGSLGALALDQEQPAQAVSHLERAIEIFDLHEGVQEGELEAHFDLARALDRMGEHSRALAEAEKAAEGFRTMGVGMATKLSQAQAFVDERSSPKK